MRCRDVQGFANAAFLGGFLCSGLLRVAPYRVPSGVKVVSASAAELPSSKGCSYWF
jgi:hypothetical protein